MPIAFPLRRLALTLSVSVGLATLLGGPATADEGSGPAHGEPNHDDRAVAAASTWTPDATLLEPQRGDSKKTRAARQELAEVYHHLRKVMASYERQHAEATAAQRRADRARADLRRAEAAAKAAAAKAEADRRMLVTLINETYAQGSTGTLGMVLSADTETELLSGLTLSEQVGRSQGEVLQAAERSRRAKVAAVARVAELDAKARAALKDANASLRRVATARDRVLADVAAARSLLKSSVLADEQAARVTGAGSGGVVFPLAPGSAFSDSNNWGNSGSNWSSRHTGNDFSAACGTPVVAATSGTVHVRTDQSWSGPWLVMVTADNSTVTTWYAHMQELRVSDGQRVEAGTRIGSVGTEGNSTGCHLHFEYHPRGGGIYEDNADPVAWLREVGAYPGA